MSQAGSGMLARGVLAVFLLAGIAAALMLTRHHESQVYGDATATLGNCPETEMVSCDTVNTSAWSELLGVPIAALAVPTYLLVLTALWKSREAPAFQAYAFSIGLLTALYSAFLFYVSSTWVGFICLYCVGLYAVNVAIPVLTLAAARRSPASLIRQTLADLVRWPSSLRFTAGVFVVLLVVTVGAQQAYRVHLKRAAAEERERIEREGGPLLPAGPSSSGGTPDGLRSIPEPAFASLASIAWARPASESGPTPEASAGARGAYLLAGPLRRLEAGPGGPRPARFDLQGVLGKGRPVALLFWSPGFRQSERALVRMAAFLRKEAPAFDVYAVAGRRDEVRDEEIFESAAMLGVVGDIPLLVDDDFVVSQALNTLDVPNAALFDAKGRLVVAKIKGLAHRLVLPAGRVPAEEVIRKVASGTEVPEIKKMAPYYPATELLGHCAPSFSAKVFDKDDRYAFSGKSAAGRPTILMLWSSTCKHCQIEIPKLQAWLKSNPARVDVVSVSEIQPDRPGRPSHREITREYIKLRGIPWVVLEDPDGAISEIYRGISTPTTYFITPGGMVIGAWFYAHGEDFAAAMENVLAEVAAAQKAGECRALPQTPAQRMAFDMLGPDGKVVSLASRLDRPALVHFWATWCMPCVEEIPALLRFGDRLEKSGDGRLVMVSVENAASGDLIGGFAKRLGLDLLSNRAPSGGLAQQLDLSYRLPRTFLLARDGVVLGYRPASHNWDDPEVTEKVLARLRNAAALAR